MREFTKSMFSYTWAMSLFGLQQTLNLITPQGQRRTHPATNAFNTVAGAAKEELGNALEAAYRAGDNIQRGFVDATFSVLTLGIFNRGDRSRAASTAGAAQAAAEFGRRTAERAAQSATDVGRGTAEAFQQTMRAAREATDVIGQAWDSGVGQAATEGTRPDDWNDGRRVNAPS